MGNEIQRKGHAGNIHQKYVQNDTQDDSQMERLQDHGMARRRRAYTPVYHHTTQIFHCLRHSNFERQIVRMDQEEDQKVSSGKHLGKRVFHINARHQRIPSQELHQ